MKLINDNVINQVISLYIDKENRRIKEPYKFKNAKYEKEAVELELQTVSYHISRFISEMDDYELLAKAEKALNIIKRQFDQNMIKDAKINISILSIFLDIKPGFPRELPKIKKIVNKTPINLENLIKIIEMPKYSNIGVR